MSNNEKEIEKAMKSAKASMEVEGYLITEEQSELVRRVLSGEITEKEYERQALERAKGK